jgi:hypothetical protein
MASDSKKLNLMNVVDHDPKIITTPSPKSSRKVSLSELTDGTIEDLENETIRVGKVPPAWNNNQPKNAIDFCLNHSMAWASKKLKLSTVFDHFPKMKTPFQSSSKVSLSEPVENSVKDFDSDIASIGQVPAWNNKSMNINDSTSRINSYHTIGAKFVDEIILSRKGDVNQAKDPNGFSPLCSLLSFVVAENVLSKYIKILLDCGFDVNSTVNDDFTPLTLVCCIIN